MSLHFLFHLPRKLFPQIQTWLASFLTTSSLCLTIIFTKCLSLTTPFKTVTSPGFIFLHSTYHSLLYHIICMFILLTVFSPAPIPTSPKMSAPRWKQNFRLLCHHQHQKQCFAWNWNSVLVE